VSIDVEALKQRTDLVSVVGSYVQLKKRGREYVGCCVAHNDSDPSMWVVPQKGLVHCFVCDFSHDVIGFVQHMEGCDFKAACEKLGATDTWQPATPIQHEQRAKMPARVTCKPPAEAGDPKMKTRELGEPSRVWTYRDAVGDPLLYVSRYETKEGKEYRAWTWGQAGEQPPRWACAHWTGPRPLYGLDKLAARSGARVVVVEGEKAADAAQALLPEYVSVTWAGGTNSWHRADWSPIAGRQVLLWPDADHKTASADQAEKLGIKEGDFLPYHEQPGQKAMLSLAALLSDPRGLACSVRIINVEGMPDGFDAADFQGTTADLFRWAKPRAKDYEPQAAPNPAPQITPAPSLPPDAPEESPVPQGESAEPGPKRKPRQRPRLHAVDGNTALAPEEEAEALPADMSEDMISSRFADQHAGTWRYVKPWSSWFEWRGDGWYKDDTAKIDRLAVEITRQAIYWPESARLTDDGRRKVNSKRTAGAVRDLAMSDRRIAATIDQWDTDHWLLGVPGGVVDLKTGKLGPASPEHYITKRTAVAPVAGDAPIWRQFLETVTAENGELIAFLQRFAGYSLTGETREQCLAFLYGTGQNGKGVFITTLARILGDYASTADADVFMEQDQARHPTEMARLRGARLVTVDETDGSKRWNEKRIKRITGGGRIEARFMRQDDFEFMPQFKLLIAGNHKPQLRGVGKAIQRRIHLVPFTVTIPDDQRDDALADKLEAEYPAILQWMIEGCLAWQREGLKAPELVREATSRYIDAEDVINDWIEERCQQTGEVARPVAYKNYRAWMEGRGERAWSSKAFKAALEEKGLSERKSNGIWYVVGISLRGSGMDDEAPSYPYQE
jgi:putative DNA primase/helicase